LANENVSKTATRIKVRNPKKEATPEPEPAPAPARTPRAKPEQEEYVPFETPESAEQTVKLDPVQGETLTPKERNAFDQLEALAGVPRRPTEKKKERQRPTQDAFLSLDDVLNEAISNIESTAEAKRATEEKALAAASKTKPPRKTEYNLLNPKPAAAAAPQANLPKTKEQRQQQSSKLLPLQEGTERMITAMEHAPTDLALWSILETDLFTPIASLQLDGPTPNSSATTTEHLTPQHRRHLMRTFPKRLILAASLFRTAYPTSNLLLSILPRLRALGPSAYALGITPNLCNQVLAFHFQKHTDLDACNSLLAEMESSIIEPNATTLQILNYILSYRDQVKEGRMGPSVQSVFQTEKFRREFKELEGWRVKVERSLEEFEIREQRKARNEEARLEEERKAVKYVAVD